jgi:hypothetical protein
MKNTRFFFDNEISGFVFLFLVLRPRLGSRGESWGEMVDPNVALREE